MKKTALIALMLLLNHYTSQAQDSTSLPKSRKFRYGLFTSLEKEYVHSSLNISTDKPSLNQGTSLGLSFRYRFSKTFSLYGGLAASAYTQEYMYLGIIPGPNSTGTSLSWSRNRSFSYQIPVYLQVNVYKERFFVSTGFELYEVLRTTNESRYKVLAQGAEKITKESSNHGLLESKLILGAGWNFKALNQNDFTLELLTKTYFLNNYSSSPGFNYILSPSLKLNWYIKRK